VSRLCWVKYLGRVKYVAVACVLLAINLASRTAHAEGPEPWVPAVAFAFSGGGLVVGTLAGIATLDKKSELDERCPELCTQDDINAAVEIADVSTAGFAIAGIAAAFGTISLVIRLVAEEEGFALRAGPEGVSARVTW
jgi:hypothetical protein